MCLNTGTASRIRNITTEAFAGGLREGGTELDRPVGDRETLENIAEATGGSALGPVDELPARLKMDPPRIVRVDRRTDIELWSRPGLLFLIVGLLGLEWLLRQRSGYL